LNTTGDDPRQFKESRMRRSMTAVLLGMLAGGCDLPTLLGSNTNGLTPEGTTCRGDEPFQPGWTSAQQALALGATGDACSFSGGMATQVPTPRTVTCIDHTLIIQSDEEIGTCTFADGGQDLIPPAQPRVGDCVHHCASSRTVSSLTCVVGLPSAPRILDVPWSLSTETDCATLLAGCPQQGDSCTGDRVCQGLWLPDGPPASGMMAVMWCTGGTLRIANSF
jgi:hypothetical protein